MASIFRSLGSSFSRRLTSVPASRVCEPAVVKTWNAGSQAYVLPSTVAKGFQTTTANFSWASRVVASTSQRAEKFNVAQVALAQARRAFSSAASSSEVTLMGRLAALTAGAPITTALFTTLARTGPCDLFAQLYVEKREEVDWRRFTGFMIFGALYVAVFQYYFYAHVLNAANVSALLGITGKAPVAIGTALMDQLVHSPLLYIPMFFLCLKMVDGVEMSELPSAVWNKWSNEVIPVCSASCTLWIPAQIVNFYFMPPHLVVPFINAVGAIWVVWLSLNEGKSRATVETEQAAPGFAAASAGEA